MMNALLQQNQLFDLFIVILQFKLLFGQNIVENFTKSCKTSTKNKHEDQKLLSQRQKNLETESSLY